MLQLVAERALTLTGADGVAIAMAEGNAIVCRAAAGTSRPNPERGWTRNQDFPEPACARGGIVRCDDSENDPRVNVQVCRRLGTRSIVAVPIASAHGTIGLLEAFSAEPHGFNDSDVRSLNLLAELILAAMKPEEENRLAEISQRVVAGAVAGRRLTAAERFGSASTAAVVRGQREAASVDESAKASRTLAPRFFRSTRRNRISRSGALRFCSCWCSGPGPGSRTVVEVLPLGLRETANASAGLRAASAPSEEQPRQSLKPSGARCLNRRTRLQQRTTSTLRATAGDGHMACLVGRLEHRDHRYAGRSAIRGPPPE